MYCEIKNKQKKDILFVNLKRSDKIIIKASERVRVGSFEKRDGPFGLGGGIGSSHFLEEPKKERKGSCFISTRRHTGERFVHCSVYFFFF